MNVVLIERLSSNQQAISSVLASIPGLEKLTVVAHDGPIRHEESWQPSLVVFGCSSNSVADLSFLTETIRRYVPLRSLVLYERPEAHFAQHALRLGIAGYVSKSSTPAVVSESIKLVLVGGRCYPPLTYARPIGAPDAGSIDRFQNVPATSAPRLKLTARQQELLGMLVAGQDATVIAARMGVAVATVRSHANKLYHKLNARNGAEAVFNATRQGVL